MVSNGFRPEFAVTAICNFSVDDIASLEDVITVKLSGWVKSAFILWNPARVATMPLNFRHIKCWLLRQRPPYHQNKVVSRNDNNCGLLWRAGKRCMKALLPWKPARNAGIEKQRKYSHYFSKRGILFIVLPDELFCFFNQGSIANIKSSTLV